MDGMTFSFYSSAHGGMAPCVWYVQRGQFGDYNWLMIWIKERLN